ncbi:hypothetical protein DdX_16474 [Ditylenchus destructor]|uniref:Uncharacterized protein n=1 Tax=Ditylenchus destructor TaxID=166010 RepID=A0AAD4MQB8_9BILA|nr:hypothetical protein DdX_16474 [Ditylenchus destructor]
MIGMMNGGNTADVPVEFYAAPKSMKRGAGIPSVYTKPKVSQQVSYTKDGRVLINGKVVYAESPEDMWQQLMLRMMCHSVGEKYLPKKERKTRKFKSFFTPSASLRSTFSAFSRSSSHRQRKSKAKHQAKDDEDDSKFAECTIATEENGDEHQSTSNTHLMPKFLSNMFHHSNNKRRTTVAGGYSHNQSSNSEQHKPSPKPSPKLSAVMEHPAPPTPQSPVTVDGQLAVSSKGDKKSPVSFPRRAITTVQKGGKNK